MTTLGDYVEKYLLLRDKKKTLDEAHKLEMAKYDDALAKLEGFFQTKMQELGLDTLKTKAGTAYTSKVYSVTTADSVAFMDFIKAHDTWHLLDPRPAKAAVSEWVEQHGVPPPGVNVTPRLNVNVRKN
jgi:hypothetical protein